MPSLKDTLASVDARTEPVGSRLVIFHNGAFHVARLNKSGKGNTYNLRVGKTAYDTLEAAQSTIAAPVPVDPVSAIRQHLRTTRSLVASHLFNDYFVVARVECGEWRHYTAKLTPKGVTLGEAYKDRGAALVQVRRNGGMHPTTDLSTLPSRPIGLYA